MNSVVWKKVLSILFARKPVPVQLQVHDTGFSIAQHDRVVTTIQWIDIMEILAFKRDLGTVDQVCFVIRAHCDGAPMTYEIHEDMEGFDALVKRLPSVLPGFDADWRSKVIQPPFATNPTIIYTKAKEAEI